MKTRSLRYTAWWLVGMLCTLAVGGVGAQAPASHEESPQAWFGLSVACSNCSWKTTDSISYFSFSVPPRIRSVDPAGPASRAGIRAGDVLVAIDGRAISTREGSVPLTMAQPGQALRMTVRRGTVEETVTVTAEARPDAGLGAGLRDLGRALGHSWSAGPPADAPVRFTGSFSDVPIEVRGTPDVHVAVAAGECWMEIVTRDTRVRLQRPGRCVPR